MFDTTKPFEVEIKSGGTRRCRLNFPSDKQWIDRTRRQKSIIVDLGHGKSRSDASPIEDFDLELFDKIRVKDASEVDQFDKDEASAAIDRLSKSEIVDSEQEPGDSFVIRMTVFGNVETVHRLRSPKLSESKKYDSETIQRIRNGRAGTIETTVALEPGGRLYDQLMLSPPEGYSEGSAVPLVHKAVVVAELNRVNSPEA